MRFNLICHGMMAFWQKGRTMSILVPDIPESIHFYGAGSVGRPPSKGNLDPLPRGTLTLEGPDPMARRGLTPLQMQERFETPVLKTSELSRNTTAIRTTIDGIPLPHEIRCYCGAEAPESLQGSTPRDVVAKMPSVLHDVIVLTWWRDSRSSRFLLKQGSRTVASGAKHVSHAGKLDAVNLGLYAQPPGASLGDHSDHWNLMMTIGDSIRSPGLRLSMPKLMPDAPPRFLKIGCDEVDLLALADLPAVTNPRRNPPSLEIRETDRTGCGSAAILEV